MEKEDYKVAPSGRFGIVVSRAESKKLLKTRLTNERTELNFRMQNGREQSYLKLFLLVSPSKQN